MEGCSPHPLISFYRKQHMRRTSFGFALLAVAVASPLSAQTWQTIGVPSNSGSGAYWNNVSDDNVGSAVCNAGAILTNTPALAPASCVNQGPVFLPLTPAPLTTSNVFLGATGGSNPGAFRFTGSPTNTYQISLVGRVAGLRTSSWGVITDAGVVFTAAMLAAGPVNITGPFAVWITSVLPTPGGVVYSSAQTTGTGAIGGRMRTGNQQFAAFTGARGTGSGGLSSDAFGTLINVGASGKYFVGMEDNTNCGRGFDGTGFSCVAGARSDRDYNDILISIEATPVPEPATIGLMGFGLLALAGVAKRRKA
jgi:hypothetical protein